MFSGYLTAYCILNINIKFEFFLKLICKGLFFDVILQIIIQGNEFRNFLITISGSQDVKVFFNKHFSLNEAV